MRNLLCAVVFGLLLTGTALANPISWEWDNYLTAGSGYDKLSARSSELGTRVVESWTGDDLILTEKTQLQSVSWIGLLELETGSQFTGADFLIYPVPEAGFPADAASILSSATAEQRFQVLPSFGRTDRVGETLAGMQVYDGSLTLSTPITLDPGHYYYAVRVHGNGKGRAYVTTTGSGQRHSAVFPGTGADTAGVFQSPWFSYPPNTGKWVLVNSMPQSTATDYAYRLQGIIVPEPASLLALLPGAIALRRRR